ncbi:MAG: hypothetical protein LUG26_07425 [Ruminococcus sp.]|nr:hypothetical protein [Ruminococcus sp.]
MKKAKIMIAVFSAIIVICIAAFIFIYTFYRDFTNSIIPSVTDEERQAALLNEVSEEIDEIYDGYYNEEISYEEAVENLNEIETSDDSSIQDLVANCQERIDKIKQSRLNYQLGEEAYAEQNYMEALTYYYAVDAIDELYYEKTKEKITIVTQEYKDYELAVADAYYQAQAYQSAVICLINVEDVFKDDTSFVENLLTLRAEYLEKWIESQREKHLYFTGDSLEEGAVYIWHIFMICLH